MCQVRATGRKLKAKVRRIIHRDEPERFPSKRAAKLQKSPKHSPVLPNLDPFQPYPHPNPNLSSKSTNPGVILAMITLIPSKTTLGLHYSQPAHGLPSPNPYSNPTPGTPSPLGTRPPASPSSPTSNSSSPSRSGCQIPS
ncbi:hypothetical protein B0T16DRAFT_451965 [Cercophora newfieldiana]|uniref:Uncharacterized protein n=1 Tax=Cercophora newfieldiana TaxID=92897 RepID=A0AA40D0U1_9PEZI|nr:hypothetical protein B0T16DRAFT_451965 [Cercophora newfieldiana]